MALLVRINEAFTDSSLPMLPVVDAMESNGSILLIDAKRSIESAENETPVVNLLNKPEIVNIPNLALTVNTTAAEFTASITSKGGLQFNPVPYKSVTKLGGAVQLLDATLLTYLKNAGHRIYTSWWGRCTRAYSSTNPTLLAAQSQKNVAHMAIGESLATDGKFLFAYTGHQAADHTIGMYTKNGELTDTFTEGSPNEVGGIRTIASFVPSPMMETLLLNVANMNVFCGGGYGVFNYNTLQQSGIPAIVSMPAVTFYRFYVEDLTISARTYDQVKALDDALYNTEVLTPGGKYYADI